MFKSGEVYTVPCGSWSRYGAADVVYFCRTWHESWACRHDTTTAFEYSLQLRIASPLNVYAITLFSRLSNAKMKTSDHLLCLLDTQACENL